MALSNKQKDTILEMLAQDARVKLVELARKTNTPVSIINDYIKNDVCKGAGFVMLPKGEAKALRKASKGWWKGGVEQPAEKEAPKKEKKPVPITVKKAAAVRCPKCDKVFQEDPDKKTPPQHRLNQHLVMCTKSAKRAKGKSAKRA